MNECIFCKIIAGQADVSKVFEDAEVMALIPLQPLYPGECMVIPRVHIDHFTDMPDDLTAKIVIVGQRIGRKIMQVYGPLRIGMVVHGFGVAHSHLNVVPQYHPDDITSRKFAYLENGEIKFSQKSLPNYSRQELNQLAEKLRE